MGTTFFEILSNHALQFIEDPRWQDEIAINPALFGRAKSQILINSIPRFNRPPNIVSKLRFTEPLFDDYEQTMDTEETNPVISTSKTEFEICSTGIVSKDEDGNIKYDAIGNSYDSETGDVTILGTVHAGDTIQIDFYTDGYFDNDLTQDQKRILGLCVAVDWYYKFANSYLNVANLITDKTFQLRSPSEHIRVNTERYRMIEGKLSAELMAYEQKLYINQFVSGVALPKV